MVIVEFYILKFSCLKDLFLFSINNVIGVSLKCCSEIMLKIMCLFFRIMYVICKIVFNFRLGNSLYRCLWVMVDLIVILLF